MWYFALLCSTLASVYAFKGENGKEISMLPVADIYEDITPESEIERTAKFIYEEKNRSIFQLHFIFRAITFHVILSLPYNICRCIHCRAVSRSHERPLYHLQ